MLGIAAALLLLGYAAYFYVKAELPRLLHEKNQSPYEITYGTLDFSVFAGHVVAREVKVSPKAALKTPGVKSGIYASVKTVEVSGVQLLGILTGDRISARSIRISKPEIILYKKTQTRVNTNNIKDDVVAGFGKVISVRDIVLEGGDVKIVYTKTQKALLHVANLNLAIDGITLDDATLAEKIPVRFSDYRLRCDSLYYKADAQYHLTTGKLDARKNGLELEDFKMTPKDSRRTFVKNLSHEKDLFVLSAQKIKVNGLDWGFKDTVFYAHVNAVDIQKAHADIYRNKLPPDDLTKKYLYNHVLRKLKFDLRVDTLRIRKSLLAYEEENDFAKGSGKLIFGDFNLTARHIESGFQRKKMPDLAIHIDCKFMDASPMTVDWRLNVLDKSDGFNIKGRILDVTAQHVNAFSKPYVNLETEGKLNQVFFNFTGNDVRSHGEFAVQYDDFRVVVYQKKNRGKKNKFLTAVGNLFVKNDTKGQVKGTKVEVERIPEKSFYNFFWRNIADGLLGTML